MDANRDIVCPRSLLTDAQDHSCDCKVCVEDCVCGSCDANNGTCLIRSPGGVVGQIVPAGGVREDTAPTKYQPAEDSSGTPEETEVLMVSLKVDERKESASQTSSSERGNWESQWDYILSVAGFAIGLANVWRFPYLCYMNGGGAFLVPYLLVLAVVGVPLYLLESGLGQFASSTCITLYDVCPIFKGVGFATFIMNLVFVTVYNVVIAYPLVFLYHSFTSRLPWASCGNPWNTEACSLADNRNSSSADLDSPQLLLSPADEFFHNHVLDISDDITELGGFKWPVVGASWFIWTFVFLCVFKGISVFGKVVWFTATFPFAMLLTLLVRGVTLPGAWEGIYFYICPDFEKLKDLTVWAAAAGQIFYSLGPGWGILTTLGSYNKFRSRCRRNAVLVPLVNCGTSILAGFVVFSVLGFMAHRTGTSVEKVTSGGPALVFITYPEALSLMPFAPFWAVLFFLMIFFLGIDSMIAHIETTTASFVDEFPRFRQYRSVVTFLICFVDILASLLFCTRGGMYWLALVDWYSATYTLILNCLCEILVFSFIYGAGRTVRDLQIMSGERIGFYWYISWLFVAPIVLLMIFVNTVVSNAPASYRGEEFPVWAQGLGWLSALVSMLAVPAYWVYYLTCGSSGSFSKRLETGLTPSEAWGPSLESHREDWKAMCKEQPLRHRLLHPDVSSSKPKYDPASSHLLLKTTTTPACLSQANKSKSDASSLS